MRKTALFAIAVLFSSWPCFAQSRPDGAVEMQRQAGELEIDGYMVKPFNPSDLILRIRSILKLDL